MMMYVCDSITDINVLVQLDQASLSLSREYLVKGMDEKLVSALYDYIVDVAVLFGAERERAMKELKESLDFEIQLANVSNVALYLFFHY